jgi:hypothetical protein
MPPGQRSAIVFWPVMTTCHKGVDGDGLVVRGLPVRAAAAWAQGQTLNCERCCLGHDNGDRLGGKAYDSLTGWCAWARLRRTRQAGRSRRSTSSRKEARAAQGECPGLPYALPQSWLAAKNLLFPSVPILPMKSPTQGVGRVVVDVKKALQGLRCGPLRASSRVALLGHPGRGITAQIAVIPVFLVQVVQGFLSGLRVRGPPRFAGHLPK